MIQTTIFCDQCQREGDLEIDYKKFRRFLLSDTNLKDGRPYPVPPSQTEKVKSLDFCQDCITNFWLRIEGNNLK